MFLIGYSKKWVTQERVVGNGSMEDPRIERDAAQRLRRHQVFRSAQAVFADLTWLVLNTIRGGFYELDVMGLVSLAVSGFGFGMKFSNLVALLKAGKQKKKTLYSQVPAVIKIATGASTDHDSEKAVVEAFDRVTAVLNANAPSLILVNMTANHDHQAALRKLQSLIPVGTPFSGCTICQGAMVGNKWVSDEMYSLTIWAC